MPLKRSYATEAEVPTEHKALYVPKEGRYVLDVEGFDNVESVLSKNNQLLSQHTTDKGEVTRLTGEVSRLTSELSTAQGSALPHGQRAVPKADAELVETVKAKGVNDAAAFNNLFVEHGQYKTEAQAAKAASHASAVGEAMGWDKEKTARLATKVYDFSSLELRDGADGKKMVVAKVKQPDGTTFVEKPFAEVVKSTPELSDLLPSLAASGGGTRVPGSTGGGGTTGGQSSIVDKFIEDRDKAAASKPNPFTKPQQQAASA